MAQAVFPYSNDILQASREHGLLKRPEMKRMTELDQAIADSLSRTDLTPSQRQQLFEDNLQKFRSVRKEIILNGTTLQPDESELENILRKLVETLNHNTNPPSIIQTATPQTVTTDLVPIIPQKKRRRSTIDKSDPITSTPVRESTIQQETPSTLFKTPSENPSWSTLKTEYLDKILNSGVDFTRDPETNIIYNRNKIVPSEQMIKAINLVFSPTKIEKVPSDVSKLGTKIAGVLKKNMKSPEFKQLTTTYPFFGQFQRTTRSKTGQGYSVDFNEWNKYLSNV
jgi:hypothetical protein